jgi:hypothetical protein
MKWWLLRIRARVGMFLIGNKVMRPLIDNLMDFREWCQEYQGIRTAIKWSSITCSIFVAVIALIHRDIFDVVASVACILLWLIPWRRNRPDDDDDEPIDPDPDFPTGDSADRWLKSQQKAGVQ